MKKSKIILVLIILVYTIISFTNLGSFKAPQTIKRFERGETSYLYFSNKEKINKVRVYTGNNISNIEIYLMNNRDSENKYYLNYNCDFSKVFTWQEFNVIGDERFSYIGITSKGENNYIGEIALLNEYGDLIEIKTIDEKDNVLVDEQDTVPEEISFLNSTYFDEVYHARTAYEQLNNISPYESVHPPLGKIIISIPISILGMTPFAYRVMGNIAGIFMILVMYYIGKELFNKEWYGIISASIMALDGMHFVQTRIATVDSFLVLFCLTSFLFMIKYLKLEKTEKLKEKLKWLLLSGIFIGLGIATKWTAFFVALGLAIIFFVHFIYRIIKNKSFTIDDWKIIGFCIVFFVIVPIFIYLISYIPLFLNKNCEIKDLNSLIKYNERMYKYHSTLEAEHPFTSEWYTWPIMKVPMWYYVKNLPSNMTSTISCMGNPFIWWFGAFTTAVSLLYMVVKRNKEAAIFLTMIACTWLPYLFIGRIMFIYHYFITLPFVMLSIVWFLKWIEEKIGKKVISIAVLIIFLICFIYYYPVYSGKIVSKKYIESSKIMDSWIY